jgi:hypothetical protein
VRGTRERLQSAPTSSITTHFFSLVYYALINVTRELALNPIYTHAPRVYVFGPHAASDDDLRARIELYDRGVDPELFVNLRNPLCWIPYNEQYLVCPSVGEVMNASSSYLVGYERNSKIFVELNAKDVERYHIVYSASHGECCEARVDHIDWRYPINDSIDNLRPASMSVQNFNKRPAEFVSCRADTVHLLDALSGKELCQYASQTLAAKACGSTVTTIGRYVANGRLFQEKYRLEIRDLVEGKPLPSHPSLFSTFQVTSVGKYRTKLFNGQWSTWRYSPPNISHGYVQLKLRGTNYYLHRLMMECLLGRILEGVEVVDHYVDRVNELTLLQTMTQRANNDKGQLKLVTGESVGDAVVYGGPSIASAHTRAPETQISARHKSGGYSWRDSTVEEVEHFFRAMDALEDLPAAVASLASPPRHGELVRALELRREREAALARLGLCDPPVGWVRGTDGCSGLSFYHREATGECRWRNPTLTRLGL